MVFIETSTFTRLLYDYLTDDEYAGLQSFLLQHPDTGDVVPGSGGLRKIRWASKVEGNVAVSELFTTGRSGTTKCGCLR